MEISAQIEVRYQLRDLKISQEEQEDILQEALLYASEMVSDAGMREGFLQTSDSDGHDLSGYWCVKKKTTSDQET